MIMTKAFMVYFEEVPRSSIFQTMWAQSGSTVPYQLPKLPDNRPILVIAKTIDEAATRFKKAIKIEELDVKDVIIDEKVDILLERR